MNSFGKVPVAVFAGKASVEPDGVVTFDTEPVSLRVIVPTFVCIVSGDEQTYAHVNEYSLNDEGFRMTTPRGSVFYMPLDEQTGSSHKVYLMDGTPCPVCGELLEIPKYNPIHFSETELKRMATQVQHPHGWFHPPSSNATARELRGVPTHQWLMMQWCKRFGPCMCATIKAHPGGFCYPSTLPGQGCNCAAMSPQELTALREYQYGCSGMEEEANTHKTAADERLRTPSC
jgi:hypothetical protein